jgi:hypothetical protein
MRRQSTQKKRAPEYHSYRGALKRCYNRKDQDYHNYGARGIVVCDRWRGAGGYAHFLEDMGRKPSSGHSLDRIDPNGNYCKENCRWATVKEQAINHRRNWIVYINDKWVDSKQAAVLLGVPYVTLANSMRGAQPLPKRLRTLVYKRRETSLC